MKENSLFGRWVTHKCALQNAEMNRLTIVHPIQKFIHPHATCHLFYQIEVGYTTCNSSIRIRLTPLFFLNSSSWLVAGSLVETDILALTRTMQRSSGGDWKTRTALRISGHLLLKIQKSQSSYFRFVVFLSTKSLSTVLTGHKDYIQRMTSKWMFLKTKLKTVIYCNLICKKLEKNETNAI